MSGTTMDNQPLPPASAEPETSRLGGDAERTAPLPPLLNRAGGRREIVLRAVFSGARWLIYLAMAGFIFRLETWLVDSVDVNALWRRLITEGSLMLAAILPGFVMARIETRPFGDFGLPRRGAFGRNFWVGTVWGIASLSVLMLALRVTGAFQLGSVALHGTRAWRFALYYAVFFLLTGFFEEFLGRGYSQWVLTKGIHFWPAAALLSISFGVIHGANPGEARIGLLAAAAIGFFFCLTLRRTGDLWWAVGFHMSWDWGESYLYSVPDSGVMAPGHLLNSSFNGPKWLTGGSVGPEGSYLVFVVLAALWVLFDRVYPEVKYRD
jgi:uncharacterized protein